MWEKKTKRINGIGIIETWAWEQMKIYLKIIKGNNIHEQELKKVINWI